MPPSKKLQWIELSQNAINKNILSLTNLAPNKLFAACVKANAYGHGITETVKMLITNNNVDYLTVHSMREAIKCRRAGWRKQIMLIGPVELCDTDAVLEFDIEPIVFNTQFLENIGKRADKFQRTVKTHLKLETGTNRQGIIEDDIEKFADIYKKYNSLGKPYGASTHFANIEDTTNHDYAEYQLAQFHSLLKVMSDHDIEPTIRHTASSSATILFDKTHFEMVRPGISLYGYWPSKETFLSHKLDGKDTNLFEPVLTWKSRITQIKTLEADSFISYGCTYQTTSKSKIAVIPVGFYDGYDRALSNKAYVLINGKRAPIRGRVCMNLMMADISDIPKVNLENEVTLIGQDGNETISANKIADWSNTINYETLARLSGEIYREILP